MEGCNLDYIPARLHTNDRIPITVFTVGELLFRRCKKEDIDNPFKISLTELSHNRSGAEDQVLSNANDVLYCIKQDEEIEIYPDQTICTLQIISLSQDSRYYKEFTQEKNGANIIASMELLHHPEPCMFPHCIFRICIEGVIVTYDNYKNTMDNFKIIRTQIREELASMIVTKRISQEDLLER